MHAHVDSPGQSVTGSKSDNKDELDDIASIYWSAVDVPVDTN